MTKFDTIIKNGTIVDGTRQPRFRGDIGIKDGYITAITRSGESLNPAEAGKVLDADGKVVAPGFIDLHTHYDAQLLWDPYLTTSGWHGVTSVVIGNCGFGFAPVKPAERERAMLGMSRIEAIPMETMISAMGLDWDWETFPEWLDRLDRQPKGLNLLSYVPINPLITYVMGIEASKTRQPTSEEVDRMCELLGEAMDAGGCGWTVQRLGSGEQSVQRDFDGTPMPTDLMSNELCLAFANVLRERGAGNIQLTQAQEENIMKDLAFVDLLAETAGRPVIWNAVIPHERHAVLHRRLIAAIENSQKNGHQVWGQAITSANDMRFTFEDFNLLDGIDAWREVTLGTTDERMAKMNDPKFRQALREHYDSGRTAFALGPIPGFVIESVINQENRQFIGKTVHELGEITGKHPIDALIDLIVSERLATVIYVPSFNMGSDDSLREVLECEYTIPGVSDGGAHTKFLSYGRYPTELLAYQMRDRQLISLEEAHYKLSKVPAMAAGFHGRGTLEKGMPADIVIYDLDKLAVTPSEIVHDLPGGEWRRVERAEGYRWILVNGTVTFDNGKETGKTPGKLLRHGSAQDHRQKVA